MPRIFSGLVLWAAVSLGAGAARAQPVEFNVHVFGINIGQLQVTTDVGASAYTASAKFRTSGLAAAFKDVRLSMHSQGRVEGGVLYPQLYTEDVNTGRRKSSARIEYSEGVPTLVSGRIEAKDHVPVPPAEQAGTIDPLTAMVVALLDRPLEGLCRIDRSIFDGGRKTRVLVNGRKSKGETVTCTGSFQRVAGYTQERLKKDGAVPLSLTYAPNGDRMRVQEIRLKTGRGPVTVVRRP